MSDELTIDELREFLKVRTGGLSAYQRREITKIFDIALDRLAAAIARAEAAEAELARLREGEGWRPVMDDDPADNIAVQLRLTTQALARHQACPRYEWFDTDGRLHYVHNGHRVVAEWRLIPDATPDD